MEIERVKQAFQAMAKQAETQDRPLDHILLYGEHALSQEIYAYLSKEMRLPTRIISAPTMKLLGDLAAVLTHLKQGDVLFIDEVHRFNEAVFTVLYRAISENKLDLVIGKGSAAKNVRLNLARFTVIAVTTHIERLPHRIVESIPVQFQLDP